MGMIEGLFGFEIFDSEVFLVGNSGKYFLFSLIQEVIFWGIQNNLKILGSACISWLLSSVIKVQPRFLKRLYFSCYIV